MHRTMRPYLRRGKRLFSAFSPAGPKGCSKDDERVLKGCLCLCHPSHNLFFRRKHLYGTILFPKFSAKVILFFDICKFCTPVLSTFYIFYLFFRTLRPLARNCIPVISSIVRQYHRPSLSSFPRDSIPRFLYVHSPAFNASCILSIVRHTMPFFSSFYRRI